MSSVRVLFGKRLRFLRKQSALTQEQLAEAADLSVNMIRLMERGKSAASPETLEKLAHALKCHPKEFFDFLWP